MLRRGLTPVAAGLALGLAAAWIFARALAAQLFAVSPHDPWTYALAAGLLALAALAACADPREALRR